MPRPAAALPLLGFTLSLGWAAMGAGASNPIPSSHPVEESLHEIELQVTQAGATLLVTRSLFNPGPISAQVELPIPLPCSAILDQVEVQTRDAAGAPSWQRAELLGASEASARWQAWIDGPQAGAKVSLDADTAVHMSRSAYGCEATLEVYPIPALRSRTVSYRVFVPSSYDQGRYTIELPELSGFGRGATLTLADDPDPGFALRLDGQPLLAASRRATFEGDRAHLLELAPRDRGHGHVHAADLDLATLVASSPAALAALDPALDPALPHLLSVDFEAPSELAQLPPVRRVVVVVDASRSVNTSARQRLSSLAGAYLEQLALEPASANARAEVLLFDREARRVYHDFVPAAWVGEDLPKLDISDGNGSELGVAIDEARALLEQPSASEGVDWIVVLSDLELRRDFAPLVPTNQAPRVHVVRLSDQLEFGPGAADDPWTAFARESGGMLWQLGARSFDEAGAARELIRPTRIWSLAVELELADGEHRTVERRPWVTAGTTHRHLDVEHRGPALARASVVGEVWGQRRAWTTRPAAETARRVAGQLATEDAHGQLSTATRTALAVHAQVVSPFTSAWAVASFGGAPAAHHSGVNQIGFGSVGRSFRCGGSRGHHVGRVPQGVSLKALIQSALDRCGVSDGSFKFETTGVEIVAVDAPSRCLEHQTWSTDISATRSAGRKQITVNYTDGVLTELIMD